MNFLRDFLLAIQVFTRLPVTGTLAKWAGFGPDTPPASAAHFPGVGWLVGVVGCVVFAALGAALPDGHFTALVAAVLSTMATIVLTGGQHEDSLARIADRLGGAPQPAAPDMMLEPPVRSYAAMALTLTLLARVSLLALLAAGSPVAVLVALFAGSVVSRFWPLLLVRTLPYVDDTAGLQSPPLSGRIDTRALAVAGGWCALPLLLALWVQGGLFLFAAVAVSGLALLLLRRLFEQRLQGLTADGVGATQQVGEVAFYLGAALALGLG